MKLHITKKEVRFYALTGIVFFLVCAFIIWHFENVPLHKTEIHETPTSLETPTPSPLLPPTNESTTTIPLATFVEITDGCGIHFEGACARVRSGPGLDFPVVANLRTGMVLKVDGTTVADGHTWHKIIFDEWLRYPERTYGDWYIADDLVSVRMGSALEDLSTSTPTATTTPTTKKIIVDRSEQSLTAYDGDTMFIKIKISTGLELTPTPRGVFTVYRKTPSRYMQGPLPGISDQYYDLPGVPWNLYFSLQGAVIHGAYWHNSFGTPYSHGCVNLSPTDAYTLYAWAELGTQVLVRD